MLVFKNGNRQIKLSTKLAIQVFHEKHGNILVVHIHQCMLQRVGKRTMADIM